MHASTTDRSDESFSLQGCDSSVLLSGRDDERSAGPDATLSPDALDLVARAKAAVDGDPRCAYKVSCADILALATRDVVSQVHYTRVQISFQSPIQTLA
jgi:Cdc6-like AAA superfamily ATPase